MKVSRLGLAGFVVAVLRPDRDLSQLNTAVTVNVRAIKPLAVMLYGAPGSGKGTFGKILSQVTRWPHISTGDLLRKHITADTEIGQASVALLEGNYAPDQIANQLVSERILSEDCHKSFVLDGYPRTLQQSTTFLPVLRQMDIEPVVVRLKLNNEAIKSRLLARVSCLHCGASFNLVFLRPKWPDQCDECGCPLVTRTDDQVGLIEKRINIYDSLTGPVERYLRESGLRLWEFDATLEPKQLLSEFLNNLTGSSLAVNSLPSAP